MWTILIAAPMMGTSILTKSLLAKSNFSPEVVAIIAGFSAAAVALAITLFLEIRQTQATILFTLGSLGLKSGNSTQLKLAALGIIPIVIGYLIIFFGTGKSAALESTAGLMI